MFNKFNIGLAVQDYDTADQLDGYSKVTIQVTDDLEYSAGSDTGKELILTCPWGSQEMANNILSSVKGFQYQPYSATGAVLDPSAEVGDALQVGDTYGGIYDMSLTFGYGFRADVSAPSEEEVSDSTSRKTSTDRKIYRQKLEMESQFQIQAGLISAKVSQKGGDSSSFGWELDEKSWTLKSNGSTVLTADKNGLEVKGIIRATDGEIGGFDIKSDYLSYNGQTWGGTNTHGAYIGVNGIQLGKNFKVDMAGNLTAESGTFAGAVHAGSIQYGESAGYLNGGGLSGGSVYGAKIATATLGTAKFTGGVNASLAYADFANGVFNGWNSPNHLKIGKDRLELDGKKLYLASRIEDGVTTRYVSWV